VKILDLFCGCGGFSYGFQMVFSDAKFVGIDNDVRVKATYEKNIKNSEFLLEDLSKFSPSDLEGYFDIIIGSPPCVEFSTANSKRNPSKGMVLVRKFKKWIDYKMPQFWIMENVPPLKKFLGDEWYRKEIFNAADFGVPQLRRRLFSGVYPLPRKTHSYVRKVDPFGNLLKKWVCVEDALKNIEDEKWHVFPKTTEEIKKRIEKLKPGEAIKGFRNSGVRLFRNRPSITMMENHGWMAVHPTEDRIITPREMARLQSFPDHFEFYGSKTDVIRMIGKAVPPLMAKAFAESIREMIIKCTK